MKRKQREIIHSSTRSGQAMRPVDASKLRGVRGGDGLGIIVVAGPRPQSYMENQHNETLVTV